LYLLFDTGSLIGAVVGCLGLTPTVLHRFCHAIFVRNCALLLDLCGLRRRSAIQENYRQTYWRVLQQSHRNPPNWISGTPPQEIRTLLISNLDRGRDAAICSCRTCRTP